MDAMANKINEILQDPESVAQLRSLASMLGGGASASPPGSDAPAAPPSAAPPSAAPPASFDGIPPDMLQNMMKLVPILRDMRRETPDTGLLRALRPLLSAPRQKKVDDAIRIMQLLNILPELKQTGILHSLFGS